jgi:hypothetical protein
MKRLSTVYLLIKVACLVTKETLFSVSNAAHLYELVQGGQPYGAFPFRKNSLPLFIDLSKLKSFGALRNVKPHLAVPLPCLFTQKGLY